MMMMMMMTTTTNRALTLLALVMTCCFPTSSAFMPSSTTIAATRLAVASHPYSDGDQLMNHDDNSDEDVRARLEQILSLTPTSHHHHHHSDSNSDNNNNNDHYEEHVLTAHRERIQQMELHLLDSLQDSNDGIDTLVDLWIGERGEEASCALHQMETHCSKGLVLEEKLLRSLIDRHGNEWAEPMSRLAVLLFTRGQYEEATHWCYAALQVKPWHFETGQLLVALWLRQENLVMAVRAAREFGLPELNDGKDHKRRRAWVAKNRAILQERLQKSRRATEDIHHDDFFSDEECLGEYCWT